MFNMFYNPFDFNNQSVKRQIEVLDNLVKQNPDKWIYKKIENDSDDSVTHLYTYKGKSGLTKYKYVMHNDSKFVENCDIKWPFIPYPVQQNIKALPSIEDLEKELEDSLNRVGDENLKLLIKDFSDELEEVKALDNPINRLGEILERDFISSKSGSRYEQVAKGYLELASRRRDSSSQRKAISRAQDALAVFVETL